MSIMKNLICLLILLYISTFVSAQKSKTISIAFLNTESAYPFSHFDKLFSGVEHPGVEIGYGFNWKCKNKHDWFQEIKVAYFFHRFVQHAFPSYTDIGYRYKFSPVLSAQATLGAGYLHSIPATAKLKLGSNGEYKNNKRLGRSQAIIIFNLGAAYTFNSSGKRPVKVFTTYQQLLQTPFVKAYVPILPYTSLLVGCSVAL